MNHNTEMKVLAFFGRKGGIGKSTLAVHTAVAAMQAGETVALINLDPQGSVSEWRQIRTVENPAVITTHPSRLPQILHIARQNDVSLVIFDAPPFAVLDLDTAPKIEQIALDIIKAADLAILPCMPAFFDLKSMKATIEIGEMAECPMRIVFNRVRARCALLWKAKNALKIYDVPISPVVISDRVVYSHALLEGLSVQEFDPKSKAAIEIQALYRYIIKELKEVEVSNGTTT